MKKTTFLFIIALFILLNSCIFNPGDPIDFPKSGNGTSDNPYKIETIDNLKWISDNSDVWDKFFVQTKDIDATLSKTMNGGKGFSPIGTEDKPFTGNYNGREHTIDSLYINRSLSNYIALFGYTDNATIDSLGLTNAIIFGYEVVGIIIGENRNSTIRNTYSTGKIVGSSPIGGLIGYNYNSVVNNCYSSNNIISETSYYDYGSGGLIGKNENSTLDDSYSTGDIVGYYLVGGLVGDNNNSTVNNCYAIGDVNGKMRYVGGLIGSDQNSTISNSFSKGNVSGEGFPYKLGGFIGEAYNSNIKNSYSTGNVAGDDDVGGFIGNFSNSSVYNCYSVGEVSGMFDVGGFIGDSSSSIIVSNSFWDMENSGIDSSHCDATGKTTSEMKDLATFTDNSTIGLDKAWDFVSNPNDDIEDNDIWQMENNNYPILSGLPMQYQIQTNEKK